MLNKCVKNKKTKQQQQKSTKNKNNQRQNQPKTKNKKDFAIDFFFFFGFISNCGDWKINRRNNSLPGGLWQEEQPEHDWKKKGLLYLF